jgi:hypothetical protein
MFAADSPDPRKLGVSRGGVIPYFADGAGWATTFRLSCLEPQCAIDFAFVGSNGQLAPMPVALTVPDQSGETVVNATESVITLTLAQGNSVVIETQGTSSDLITGAVDVRSNQFLAGMSTFRQRVPERPDFEATVFMESRIFTNAFLIPFDNRAGFATGVAITNLTNNRRADVMVTGVDLATRTLFTGTISLEALNGTTFDLAARFPEAAGKVGLIQLSAQGAAISGTGFRFNPTGSFSTVPIFNLQ